MKKIFVACSILFIEGACHQPTEHLASPGNKIFTLLKPTETGIDFINALEESEDFDVFRYRNYYNGAGVGIGDINNDGLPDVYLTANSAKNKLYLNQGNFSFKDITQTAGVGGEKAWSTGVSMVDINGDGFLDIYVCNSGDIKGDDKENELFINNGDLTFTERAKEYGLADKGFSTHAVFFDYDKDGDLDCYLLNNSFLPVSTLGYRNIRHERDKLGGDKFFRNDNGYFNDISEHAGIYGSVIGFGLGVTVGDVNHDHWPDIYISNDFFERDYLYINNQDSTFSEQLEQQIGHCSMFSMGADIADINNDGYLDIFSTDMLPASDYRLKTITAFESYDVYLMKQKNGYYHQYMRNMLQLNNKNGTFSEIGRLAGVSATDWSWGSLITDFDNDGVKEIFVSNGIYRDVTDQDFLEFMANEENIKAALEGRKINYQKVIKDMPSHKLSNVMFQQDSLLHYHDVSAAWGLDEPGYSNGSAYGDLDNDGDLDLIINNVNQELFVYRNDLKKGGGHNAISLTFTGSDKNTFGVGASVAIFHNDEIITYEQMPIRGYQSSMDYKMIIGLGNLNVIDSMVVTWPNEKIQSFKRIPVNQTIRVNEKNATQPASVKNNEQPSWLIDSGISIDFTHHENSYNDFNHQRLLYQMLSTEGPALATGDLNQDGLDDFYIGGASGQSGKIFTQSKSGTFIALDTNVFDEDSVSEDVDALFFDADNDHDLDLYVVSGGSEFPVGSPALQDRLYINDGDIKGKQTFHKARTSLPAIRAHGSCVAAVDVDQDHDLDLFVGTRMKPGHYGEPCQQYLLANDGRGNFLDVSSRSSDLASLGMVTDATWFNFNDDTWPDLMIVGDWMPVTIFKNVQGILQKADVPSLSRSEGWWNRLTAADLDHDGDTDFIIGNLGWNSKFKPTRTNPVSLYVGDFNKNGSSIPVITYRNDTKDYPFSLKQDLVKEIYSLNKKFIYYRDYAGKSMDDIFDKDIKYVGVFPVYEPATSVLENKGNGVFRLKPLPLRAQQAPVYGIEVIDVDNDSILDIVLGGNLFALKTDLGRYDALNGLILKGDGKNNFYAVPESESGFRLTGEIRNIRAVRGYNATRLLFSRNNSYPKLYTIPREK